VSFNYLTTCYCSGSNVDPIPQKRQKLMCYINVPQRYSRTAGLVHRKYPDFCVQYKENHERRRLSGRDSMIAEGTAQAGAGQHRRPRRWLTLTTFLADPP
jgi:hypothetical protein